MSCDSTQTKPDLPREEQPEKKCKQRLILGDGDFSYTEALINKHINTHKLLVRAIVATELTDVPEFEVDVKIMNQRSERIKSLKEKGVRVLFRIDGRELHENPQLKGERFKRIHWNCPFRWSTITDEEFIQVIVGVFQSCSKVQLNGDRIHITLLQGECDEDWKQCRQYVHNIVKGSVQNGYKLIRKRRFGRDRYPGYQHRKGDDLEELHLAAVHREFVFEKDHSVKIKTEEEIISSLPLKISNPEKTYVIDVNKKNVTESSKIRLEDCYFICSTDDDSSDYYSSD